MDAQSRTVANWLVFYFVLKFVFRFSLLLLEPSEIYFEDFSVFHYPYDLPEEEAIKRYIILHPLLSSCLHMHI